MRKLNSPSYFTLFLESQGIDSNKFEYISKDCNDYKVRNIETGIVISIFSRENTLIFSIVSTPKYAIIVKNITHNIIVPYPLFFIFF